MTYDAAIDVMGEVRKTTRTLTERKSAEFSGCGTYRILLSRVWDSGLPLMAFCGVNPSTADHETDDATVRKMRGFAERTGHGGFVLWNLFPYRATDVRQLRKIDIYEATGHYPHVPRSVFKADTHVAAWGSLSKLPKPLRSRASEMARVFEVNDIPLYCFGRTQSGDPRHPLMTPYDTPLTEWRWTAAA